MSKSFFVSGIDTEIGKTVVSAILVKALKADYWKPVQSGDLDRSDSHKVAEWAGLQANQVHPEQYRLSQPMSPHASAAYDGVAIDLEAFSLPATEAPLIVEGAGGLMVPFNEQHCMIDLIAKLQIPMLLVSKNYLGSINHTLLSCAMLAQRNINVAGIIFNGPPQPTSTSIIQKFTDFPVLFHLQEMATVDAEQIALAANQHQEAIQTLLL